MDLYLLIFNNFYNLIFEYEKNIFIKIFQNSIHFFIYILLNYMKQMI